MNTHREFDRILFYSLIAVVGLINLVQAVFWACGKVSIARKLTRERREADVQQRPIR